MNLQNDFYTILSFEHNDLNASFQIRLNPEHMVYKGHFPGYPVTPGVIQLQIVHELLEKALEKKLKMNEMAQSKFLHVLNPEIHPEYSVSLKWTVEKQLVNVRAFATLPNDSAVVFKVSANYELY